MAQKIFRGVRLESVLSARCNAKATESGLTFSEWVRHILRQAVGLEPKRKKGS